MTDICHFMAKFKTRNLMIELSQENQAFFFQKIALPNTQNVEFQSKNNLKPRIYNFYPKTMKNFIKVLFLSLLSITTFAQQATEIDSKSLKLPRYADEAAVTAAIPTPTQGMLIYRNDTKSNWYFDGTDWKNISTSSVGSGGWTSTAFGIYPTNLDQNVGIGMDQPVDKLEINGDMSIMNNGSLEFGKYISGKETNAGKMGYGLFTANTLDIVGAGNSYLERRIRFWAEGGSTFEGGATFNKDIRIRNNGPNTGTFINTQPLNVGTSHNLSFQGSNYVSGDISMIGTGTASARMGFRTGYSSTAPGSPINIYERLTIANNGNVGIGNTNPKSNLDISGDLNTTGLIKVNDVSGLSGQVLTSNGVSAPTWSNQAFTNNIRFGVNMNQISQSDKRLNFNTIYNTAPDLITVIPPYSDALNAYDSQILVAKAGLYRINGSLNFQFTSTSLPVQSPSANLSIRANNFDYYIANQLELPRLALSPGNIYYYYGLLKEFSIDVYMEANTKISILSQINQTASGILVNHQSGSFSGYLISE